jgi:hypothetical protein
VYIRRIRVDPCPILAWLSSYLETIEVLGDMGDKDALRRLREHMFIVGKGLYVLYVAIGNGNGKLKRALGVKQWRIDTSLGRSGRI